MRASISGIAIYLVGGKQSLLTHSSLLCTSHPVRNHTKRCSSQVQKHKGKKLQFEGSVCRWYRMAQYYLLIWRLMFLPGPAPRGCTKYAVRGVAGEWYNFHRCTEWFIDLYKEARSTHKALGGVRALDPWLIYIFPLPTQQHLSSLLN